MNNTKAFYLFVTVSAFLILACRPDDEINVNEKLLPGVWRLEHVTFNEVDGTTINGLSTSRALILVNDSSYLQNYVRGDWWLKGNKIILNPEEGFVGFDREYELLELSDKTLKLKFSMTDRQYCCDFDQFQDDEVLTIIETYRRDD